MNLTVVNSELSRTYFEKALRFDPENPSILNYYAALLVRSGNAGSALPFAERAVRAAPNSPDTLAVLGYAQFATDHNREALISWKRSLELRPDAQIKALTEKAQRESAAEANYSERESSHFTLRDQGSQVSDSMRAEILAALEADYSDLVRRTWHSAEEQHCCRVVYRSGIF